MATKRKSDEPVYESTRVKGLADGEFAVMGTIEGEATEVVVSTHPTVDEAIKALS